MVEVNQTAVFEKNIPSWTVVFSQQGITGYCVQLLKSILDEDVKFGIGTGLWLILASVHD